MTALVLAAIVLGAAVGLATRRVIVTETQADVPAWLVVTGTGVLAGLAAWRFGLAWDLPAYLYLAAITVPLAVIDLRTQRLPNAFTLPAYPITAVLLLIPAATAAAWASLGRAAACGAAVLALYALLHVINPSGMGLGDVKLAGPLGALLGWVSWNTAMWGTFLGFLLGAVVGLALLVSRRAGRKSALPFGPFMLAGAWIALLVPAFG